MRNWRNTTICDLSEEVDGVTYFEKWEDIDGYNGVYQVSTFGRVKSFVVSKDGRIRKGVLADGYPQVQLKGRGNGTFETKKIHRLVGMAFIPNPDKLPEINHKEGNRWDCRVWMLEWTTSSDNVKHAYRKLGKKNNLENQKGENHYNAKFKIQDILEIRKLFEKGDSLRSIADLYNEKKTDTIRRIVLRQRWKHI